ncbi:MAG: hypothetical protein N2C14_25695, partial [Planctomycetales bacterium]
VKAASALTGFKPYTIRQGCNNGRLPADKCRKDPVSGQWRIHRELVDQIKNHGLPRLEIP